MTISKIFHLSKSQAELDFVDIDPNQDLPLFLDPFFLGKRSDRWSIEATQLLKSFFEEVIRLIKANQIDDAKELFDHLHEPNATCLGVSLDDPQGRGIGQTDTDNIFESLLRSKAIQSGLLQDIEDSVLFVEGFGKDKLSDMTTNIITKKLIEYTIDQCVLHGIPLTQNIAYGFYWDGADVEWKSDYSQGLVIEKKKILLVPKGIVSFCKAYTPQKYYDHFVLRFLQNEHIKIKSVLVQKRKKDGVLFVTKKSLKEKHPASKYFLRKFTADHPEVLQLFKSRTMVKSLHDQELPVQVNLKLVVDALIRKLGEIKSGNDEASDYHTLMIGVLEIIFYPHLINPRKEVPINDGRKRIDITFDNSATHGIFKRFADIMSLPCSYIFIECKNYSRDVQNPELDQIAGRFHINKGKVGFVVCRTINDLPLFLSRCRDTYSAGNGLVIPLVDKDIIQLLRNQANYSTDFVENFLSDRVREIVLK